MVGSNVHHLLLSIIFFVSFSIMAAETYPLLCIISLVAFRSKDYRKVPIVTVDDAQINGSDEIIDGLLKQPAITAKLEERWDDGIMNLADFATSESATKWIKYANDDLASLLYPNICRTLSDSYGAFEYVNSVDTFSPLQRVTIRGLGSLAMYFAASKIKSKSCTADTVRCNDVLSMRVYNRSPLTNAIYYFRKAQYYGRETSVGRCVVDSRERGTG
jgi:hypothetical protein